MIAAGFIAQGARVYAEREPVLDILVNNAGAAWGAPLEEFPESGWDKVMNLNVKPPFSDVCLLVHPVWMT